MQSNATYGQQSLDAFHAYWHELLSECRDAESTGQKCVVPQRRAFNPMKIHRYLQHVYIGELKSDEILEVRLSGTAIDEAAGFSLKGGNYLDICPPEEHSFFIDISKAVVGWPCGMTMTRSVTLKNGRVHQLQSLSFPLADREGVPRYIVGVANVAKDIAHGGYPQPETVISEIKEFKFIDIGAGTPPPPPVILP